MIKDHVPVSKAALARQLGVSRTYVTLLIQGKRRPSQQLANKLQQLQLTVEIPVEYALTNALVGKRGFEPRRLAAHDPKSCASDNHSFPSNALTNHVPTNGQLQCWLTAFIDGRRQGLSPNTLLFYNTCLKPFVSRYELTPDSINLFLGNLTCSTGAKLCYFRAIRAFTNWLIRNDYVKDNPIRKVDPPKPKKKVLPSLTMNQVQILIEHADNLRDKAIVSLLADSGMRLSELSTVKAQDLDWDNHTVLIWGKGGKQRRAPFTERTANLLAEFGVKRVSQVSQNMRINIWGMKRRSIQNMLLVLSKKTGLPCNPHTFRRTFASNLHRSGLDIEHIMRLGGWESLDMVVRYTRSVKFEESLKLYRGLEV
jgi:site-specific recombinase XerD